MTTGNPHALGASSNMINGLCTMGVRLFKGLAVAAAAAAFLFAPTGNLPLPGLMTASAQGVIAVGRNGSAAERVKLGLNKSIVIDLPADAHDVLVANPEVADAVSRTARRIYLFGKKVGQTNIFVFDNQGNQLVSLDLEIERDVAGLDRHLARFIPGSDIDVEIINDNIVLTGTVQTPQDSARATQLAEIFLKGGDETTRGGDIGFFFGIVGDSQIVNLLEIVGDDQVTLKVTVAEIQRSVMKQLGTSLNVQNSTGDVTFGLVSQGSFGALGKPINSSGLTLGGSFGDAAIQAQFQAMEEAGVMKTLAEPTLTAVSGEMAVFRAGGEYNIIDGVSAPDEDGGLVYSYRQVEYGVGLEFTPVVLSPGRINLRIRTSVSEPTAEASVPGLAGNTSVLSLRKRLADTTVELPSGGSMMIAGLLRDDVRQAVGGFPGLSKLPVLGALFRSKDYVRNETELVILVTAYLARPVAPTQLARPTDNFNPTADGKGALLGRVNRIYGNRNEQPPAGPFHGSIGFIYK